MGTDQKKEFVKDETVDLRLEVSKNNDKEFVSRDGGGKIVLFVNRHLSFFRDNQVQVTDVIRSKIVSVRPKYYLAEPIEIVQAPQ